MAGWTIPKVRMKGAAWTAAAVAAAVGYGIYIWKYQASPDLSKLSIQDVGTSKRAATVKRLAGLAAARNGAQSRVVTVVTGMPLYLGTEIQVSPKGFLEVLTEGNWLVGLDAGQFTFVDARTDASRSVHGGTWFVKRGQFRAKPHDQDRSRHVLEVRAGRARIRADGGEIGVTVRGDGHGHAWLIRGKAWFRPENGSERSMTVKVLENF